jgi:uncharacterized YigZ family protein
MIDEYLTIEKQTEGLFKDKGSKFIAYAIPILNIEDINTKLEEIRKLHPKSRHACYAWRLGADKNKYRINDDGEPSGTAGKPILGQIDKCGYSDILVVVIRYFGGTLLGTSGLILAYRESTIDALEKTVPTKRYLTDHIQIKSLYEHDSKINALIRRYEPINLKATYGQLPEWNLQLRKNATDTFILELKATITGVSTEQAEQIDDIEGLELNLNTQC